MIRWPKSSLLALTVFSYSALGPHLAFHGVCFAQRTASVDQEIRATAKQFLDAFNRHDAKAVAALWTTNGQYIDESGELTSGRDAIAKKYAEFFAANPDARMEVSIDNIQVPAPGCALENGTSRLTHAGASPSMECQYEVVHVKVNGQWQMASVRDLPPTPSPASAMADLDWLIGTWHAENLGSETEIDFQWLTGKTFIQATISHTNGDSPSVSATQIIGVDPVSGRITAWMFQTDGGMAAGPWIPYDDGWAIQFDGALPDGTPTRAVNTLLKLHDALVWKSTSRTLGGVPLSDTEELILKRKK